MYKGSLQAPGPSHRGLFFFFFFSLSLSLSLSLSMTADVSFLMGFLSRYDKEDGVGEGNSGGDLVTRDLLGACFGNGGVAAAATTETKKELDVLVSQPEKAVSHQRGGGGRPLQDLNMPPVYSPWLPPPSLPGAPSAPTADLKLLFPARPPPPSVGYYQSACTLEKVKSALERAHRDDSLRRQPEERPVAAGCASPPSSSSTMTPSAKRRREAGRDDEGEGESRSTTSSLSSVVVQADGGGGGGADAAMAAAGCPNCLLYVLISRVDPRCPRCNARVPLPPPAPGEKRPRIDLNAAATAVEPLKTVIFF